MLLAQMDAWKPRQIRIMEVGGNKRLQRFFKKQGIEKQPINTKYAHPALEEYRERSVASAAEFIVVPQELSVRCVRSFSYSLRCAVTVVVPRIASEVDGSSSSKSKSSRRDRDRRSPSPASPKVKKSSKESKDKGLSSSDLLARLTMGASPSPSGSVPGYV